MGKVETNYLLNHEFQEVMQMVKGIMRIRLV